jgi:hypothetical protein
MSKLPLAVLVLLLPIMLRAQVISGKVYRAGTDSVIPHASIYLGGTLSGTISNKEGAFRFVVLEGKIPLVVSCVGYYSTVVNDYSPAQFLKVYLKPKINELKGITINANQSKSREAMVRMFTREFIGTTRDAASCKILNIDDIDLHYSKKTRTLTAFCDNPIEIENARLAYHISYYLDYFNMKDDVVSYNGNFVFKDKATDQNRKVVSVNREKAYEGSRMQFIRALWHNTLDDHYFSIYTETGDLVSVDSILFTGQKRQKFIALPYKINILFDGDTHAPTGLFQSQPRCYIDQNGFCDDNLQWFGQMAIQRVGDMLPFEYRSVTDDPPQQKVSK